MDVRSRQTIAFRVGDRSRESVMELWQSIPESYIPPDEPDGKMGNHSQGVYAIWAVSGEEPFNYSATKLAGTTSIMISAIFIDAVVGVEPGTKLSTT